VCGALVAVPAVAGRTSGGEYGVAELPGPGSDLGDGFTVPVGTRVLGPINRGPGPDGNGFEVMLQLVGDPEAAMRDAVAQAEDHGLRLRGDCFIATPSLPSCSIGATRIEDGFVLERFGAGMFISTPEYEARGDYAAQMGMSYSRWPPGELPAADAALRPYGGLGRFPELPPTPEIPGTDEVMPQSHYTDDQVFRVVPGTRVIAPVRTLDVCNGGFFAHVQVTGDLDRVVDETRRRFEHLSGIYYTTVEEGRSRDHATLRVDGGNDASARFEVVIGNPGEPTWATVEYCTD
jgi:hypothetical protein